MEAKLLLKKWINANVEMEIVQCAKELGHSVLFTPPHYSDLQPIELVWALIKNNVAKSYKKGITFTEVRANLDKQFEALCTTDGSNVIGRIIDSVDAVIEKCMNEITREEGALDESDFSDLSHYSMDLCSDASETESE